MFAFFHKHIKLIIATVILAGVAFGIDDHSTADTSTNSSKTSTSAKVSVQATYPIHAHAYALRKNATLYTDARLSQGMSAKPLLKDTWYRSQAAKLLVKGKPAVAYKLTNASGKYTYWALHSSVKSINSKSFNVKLAAAGNQFTNKRIGFFGDSIPAGWDGYHFYLNNAYGDWLAKYLGTNNRIINEAVPSAKIVGHRFAYVGPILKPQDLTMQIRYHKSAIQKMNMIFIHIGTNDYTNFSSSGSLENVINHLKRNVQYIQKLNPNAKIYGVLPISRYTANGFNRENIMNDSQYTYGQLRHEEALMYRRLGATVIDFQQFAPNIITSENKDVTLEDREIHPTAQTAQKLGYALARKLAD